MLPAQKCSLRVRNRAALTNASTGRQIAPEPNCLGEVPSSDYGDCECGLTPKFSCERSAVNAHSTHYHNALERRGTRRLTRACLLQLPLDSAGASIAYPADAHQVPLRPESGCVGVKCRKAIEIEFGEPQPRHLIGKVSETILRQSIMGSPGCSHWQSRAGERDEAVANTTV